MIDVVVLFAMILMFTGNGWGMLIMMVLMGLPLNRLRGK
jgi:hypothetical protein